MIEIPIYVLAGGRSSRFGRDKARAPLHGRPLLQVAVEPFAGRPGPLTVVADVPDKYKDLGLRTLGDLEPDRGPLGGLLTALADRARGGAEGWLLLTACDFVGTRPAWIDLLAEARRPGARAVAFRGERWEPLFALYHTALREEAAAELEAGRVALWRLLDRVHAISVGLPADWSAARSLDTPRAVAEHEKSWQEEPR
jgi:molybdopterin-guanine dinucleotide biosynthesis protein A